MKRDPIDRPPVPPVLPDPGVGVVFQVLRGVQVSTAFRGRGGGALSLTRLVLIFLLLAGCVMEQSGPRLHTFGPAQTPHGIEAILVVALDSIRGEVLEVTDRGILFLEGTPGEGDRILEIRWEEIRRARFTDYRMRWDFGGPPPDPVRARLALLSRHPPGLTPEQRRRVLEAHGQTEPHPYRPRATPAPSGSGGPGSGAEVEHGAHAHPSPGRSGVPVAPHSSGGAVDPLHAVPTAGATAHSGEAADAAAVADFLDRTRAALAPLATPEEAGLAGYRLLGPDFPGMGEHWVNPYLVLRSGSDPARPPLLTYLQTPEGPILTGAAFLEFLGPGDSLPAFPFPGAWHEHSGTVDEETLALNPAAALHPAPDDPRIAMLHAWVGLENPDGVFAQDNWSVPFVRLGLPVPPAPTPSAGKALFLASGGDAHYAGLLRLLGDLDPDEARRVDAVLGQERTRVEGWLADLPPQPTGAQVGALLPQLEASWMALWHGIREALEPERWARVAVLGG